MTWSRWKKQEVKPIPVDMIDWQAKLENGATFTKLKPGIATGAETQEFWKQCGPRLNHSTRVLR